MEKYQAKGEKVNLPDFTGIVESLEKINQFVRKPHAFDSPSENDLNNLETSIQALQEISESARITFESIVGGFITRAQAKPLRKEFKNWADNIFRAGVIKKMCPLYINASLVSELLKRIDGDDFVEISLGKKDDKLCVMMAAVTKKGDRVDDPDKIKSGADLLDDMRPCPQPPCPVDLD